MPISVYNSLSRKKEEFIPLNPPQVNIYTCGVTVYDECHIGHARSLYIFDVIRRYLEFKGFKVNFVRNITDIDDKIIKRAQELKIDWKELVEGYIDSYYEDLALLNIRTGIKDGEHEPRATGNIAEMIKYIEDLINKGYAYITDTGVYFSVRKFADYGKLSGQGLDQMLTGVRKEPDETKDDPLDFALWKISKPGEPSWKSPWKGGRPGWHIECSVMSTKYLKTDTLDIHAGGRDLIFPHHENEIAQSQARTGRPFAKYWIHHGLLTIDAQKMAKSLGNFVTVKDFIARYKNADLLKMFFLTGHYAHPIDYTDEKIKEAREALERILILLEKIERKVKGKRPKAKGKRFADIESLKDTFFKAMDDDFNMPRALSFVFELVSLGNKNIDDDVFLWACAATIRELLAVFGISLGIKEPARELNDAQIKQMLAARDQARKNKEYALSDQIRKELEEKGIILEDTKEGTTYRRKL